MLSAALALALCLNAPSPAAPPAPAAKAPASASDATPLPVWPSDGSKTEQTFGDVKLTLRPAHIRPGAMFEVEARGEGLTAATAHFGSAIPLFEVEPGHLRGYGAVPLTQAAGKSKLAFEVVKGKEKPASHELPLEVDAATFSQHTLKVAPKFTNPSKKDAAWMRADNEAFNKAYEVAFAPPAFHENFLHPREGAGFTSRFGERRVFNGKLQSRHWGLDLEGRTGDPIYASNDGVVRMVRPCFGSGNTVLISHGAGLFTSYFHMSEFLVKEGDVVKRGQLIGKVGKTGRVTGPHLHLSVKLNGIAMDPESLLGFDFFPGAPVPMAETPVEKVAPTIVPASAVVPAAPTDAGAAK